MVNEHVRAQQCSETKHAEERRSGSAFCADCGMQLIFDR